MLFSFQVTADAVEGEQRNPRAPTNRYRKSTASVELVLCMDTLGKVKESLRSKNWDLKFFPHCGRTMLARGRCCIVMDESATDFPLILKMERFNAIVEYVWGESCHVQYYRNLQGISSLSITSWKIYFRDVRRELPKYQVLNLKYFSRSQTFGSTSMVTFENFKFVTCYHRE